MLRARWVLTRVPTRALGKATAWRCCCSGLLLLLLVLIPGLGATVNGARRWMRIGPMNFQVSELAKVLVLTWVCSYCVRKRAELAQTLPGPAQAAWRCSASRRVLLLVGARFRRRHGAVRDRLRRAVRRRRAPALRARCWCAAARRCSRVLALTSAYRLKRLTVFLHPWDDPFNGGFQLTQSLIAIGRGAWFGVGLGSSVQKLFYLPEAHTDFVFAVLAEELGLVGVIGVLALFLALVWRAFQISRMAAQAGLQFQSYVALAFGVWLGLQADREHRRQHGRAADQGSDAAAAQLRPQQPAGEPGLDRRAAAHSPRDQVHVALRGHALPGRRPR